MKQKETCSLCQGEINIKKDNFCHLIDYRKGKFIGEGFYHIICWNNNLKKNKEAKQMAFDLLKRANTMMDNLEGRKQIYEVK
jgi:hypothetical protein